MGQYALNSFTDLSVFKTWFVSENKKAENHDKKFEMKVVVWVWLMEGGVILLWIEKAYQLNKKSREMKGEV